MNMTNYSTKFGIPYDVRTTKDDEGSIFEVLVYINERWESVGTEYSGNGLEDNERAQEDLEKYILRHKGQYSIRENILLCLIAGAVAILAGVI